MGPDHLRVDLRLAEASCAAEFSDALSIARQIDAKLEVAIIGTSANMETLRQCRSILSEADRDRIAGWLIFHPTEKSTPRGLLESLKPQLEAWNPSQPVVVGTDAYFAELNRHRPENTSGLVSYSINPQVHASDSLSIRETLEALTDTIESAVHATGCRIVISPVTLKPRFNPNATSGPASLEVRLREAIDHRQTEGFAAAWIAAVVSRLATHVDVESLTLYEAAGPRGAMDYAAREYPVASFFDFLFACKRLFPVQTSSMRDIGAMGTESATGERHLILMNLTDSTRRIRIRFEDGLANEATVDGESLRILAVGKANA